MSLNTILVLIGSIILFAWYQLYSLRNKVLVTYRRPSGQRFTRLVPLNSRTIIFDKMQFTIVPDRAGLHWYKLLWGMFGNIGTWVIAYDFSWYSEFPHDPKNFKVTTLSPESRRAMNNESSYAAYNRSVDKQSGRKQGMGQYLPYLLIAIVIAIVAYYLYSMISAQGAQLKAMSEAIRMLQK